MMQILQCVEFAVIQRTDLICRVLERAFPWLSFLSLTFFHFFLCFSSWCDWSF